MTTYLDNLKWIVSGKIKKEPLKILDESFEINSTNGSGFGFESDSDHEYDKIVIDKQIETNNPKENYDKIYKELVDTEKLIRKRVNSDTIEKIKENYVEYINDDVQIIKEFALIMETFDNIKTKLKNFELEMNYFESGIKKFTTNKNDDNLEINNKFNQIDNRLENTVEMINKIKFNYDDFMVKIIHLENLIKIHDEHRNEILLKLDNFNKEHNDMKNNNLKALKILKDSQQYFIFSDQSSYNNYIKYLSIGLGICSCVVFSYKFLKKN